MEDQHNRLLLLLDAMPRHYSLYSCEQLNRITAEYKKILTAISANDNCKCDTVEYVEALKNIERQISKAKFKGKHQKEKEEAFSDAQCGLEFNINALAQLIEKL